MSQTLLDHHLIEILERDHYRISEEELDQIFASAEYHRYLRILGYRDIEWRVAQLREKDEYWQRDNRRKALRRYRKAVRNGERFTHDVLTVSKMLARAKDAGVAQVAGSDLSLAEFWAKAAALAERRNLCSMYDGMASALGGPRRDNR